METYMRLGTAKTVSLSSLTVWDWTIGLIGPIWFLLELLTMFTNEKGRALHDFIAGSVVCKDG